MKGVNLITNLFTDVLTSMAKKQLNLQQTYRLCPILVGNGRQDLHGSFINNFKCVVRMNEFKIKGYEDLVGTRTDIVAARPRFVSNEAHYARQIWWVGHKSSVPLYGDFQGFEMSSHFQVWLEEAPMFQMVMEDLRVKAEEYNGREENMFSVGFMAAMFMLQLTPQIVVTGYDWGASGHYANAGQQMIQTYDWEFEKQVFTQLIADEYVVPLHRVISQLAPLDDV
jgi:hypothetical protein